MVLGFLTASCNKQNVAPKNADEKVKTGTGRFITAGTPIYGSGLACEVPYFFANSNGVPYPTSTNPIKGLKLKVDEAAGYEYKVYISTDPNFEGVTLELATTTFAASGETTTILADLNDILPTTSPNTLNLYVYLESTDIDTHSDIADLIVPIAMHQEFAAGMTPAPCLKITTPTAGRFLGTGPGNMFFNLTISKDLTNAADLTSAMLATDYKLNTTFVSFSSVGSEYVSGVSITPVTKPTYLGSGIFGSDATPLSFTVSLPRNKIAYLMSGYASINNGTGSHTTGTEVLYSISLEEKVFATNMTVMNAVEAQLGLTISQ